MTPIQELIDWTNKMENSLASLTFTETEFRLIEQLREKFKEQLPKEKQIIMDAHEDGFFREGDESTLKSFNELAQEAEQYYNKTFPAK